MLYGHAKTRIIVDPYIDSSLKETTENKRVIHARECWKCWLWYDYMLMSTTLIDQPLSCASTQHKLTYHLTHVSLEHFTGKAVNVVEVVCDTDYQPRIPTKEHSHVEVDTLIPPHVILSIPVCILQETNIWSPDRHKRPNAIHGLGWSHEKDLHNHHPPPPPPPPPLSLDENDKIFDTFGHFKERSISVSTVDGRKTLLIIPVSV